MDLEKIEADRGNNYLCDFIVHSKQCSLKDEVELLSSSPLVVNLSSSSYSRSIFADALFDAKFPGVNSAKWLVIC